jgi:hypothetical protein
MPITSILEAIGAGLLAASALVLLIVLADRRWAPTAPPGTPAGAARGPEPLLTGPWRIALILLVGVVATYRATLGAWPEWPPIGSLQRLFWTLLVIALVAAVDALPRIPALVRLSTLIAGALFAVIYVPGPLLRDYTGFSYYALCAGLVAWLLAIRAGFDVSTRHGSWKPFDAVVLAIAIGFIGATLAGTGTMTLGQLAWGLGGGAGAIALGIIARRELPTSPAYATMLGFSLGTLLVLGVFGGATNPLPWWAAVLVSLAPAGRFLARVGPLKKVTGWPTLVVRAALVIGPAAIVTALAVLATTTLDDLNQ